MKGLFSKTLCSRSSRLFYFTNEMKGFCVIQNSKQQETMSLRNFWKHSKNILFRGGTTANFEKSNFARLGSLVSLSCRIFVYASFPKQSSKSKFPTTLSCRKSTSDPKCEKRRLARNKKPKTWSSFQ